MRVSKGSANGFLLLPSDGLLLLDGTRAVSFIDRTASELLAGLGVTLELGALQPQWPELSVLISAQSASLRDGFSDHEVRIGSNKTEVRLFRSDKGVGVGLISDPSLLNGPTQAYLDVLQGLLFNVHDSVLVARAEPLDSPGPVVVYANQSLLNQTGYQLEQILGRSPRMFQGPGTDRDTTQAFGKALRRWEAAQMEVLNYHLDGSTYWTDLRVVPVVDASGWYTHWISSQRDVSRRRSNEEALMQLALTDSLTGLPNRQALQERLHQALERMKQIGGRVALLFCDLDRFKDVNDRHGHLVGDQLLQEIARRMQSALRANDLLARLGGDEFVVMSEGAGHDDDLLQLADRLRVQLAAPWPIGNELFLPSMSVGIASTNDPEISAVELLRRADLTMLQVKSDGRDSAEIYNKHVDSEIQQNTTIRQLLRQAVRNGGLLLHYQPLVHLPDGQVMGAEALVRMEGPGGELIPPNKFILQAEQSGLLVPLEQWVINEALTTLGDWRGRGLIQRMAINVSPNHLTRNGFVNYLLGTAERLGVDPSWITVEMTEWVMLREPELAARELAALREAGVQVALDDFGTGYSSLGWLSELPVDVVKIDRCFITNLGRDQRRTTLVRGFLRTFQDLGLKVVAEGIETQEHHELLLDMGCLLGQGYLFGKPCPANTGPWISRQLA